MVEKKNHRKINHTFVIFEFVWLNKKENILLLKLLLFKSNPSHYDYKEVPKLKDPDKKS